jgi:FlaA1/EpsC-like NDP-sugar epimerase
MKPVAVAATAALPFPTIADKRDAVVPRGSGRTISEAIVGRLMACYDAAAILGSGIAALNWDALGIDWRLSGLVVLLGTLLCVNLLHFAGAHRFSQFGRLDQSLGRALLGWVLTLLGLLVATRLVDPVTAADGPWLAAWFAGGTLLLGGSRLLLWRKMKHWQLAGRLGEVVAIVGAGPVAQRLLRDLNAHHTNLRIVGVYDDKAPQLPSQCMGYPIRGTVDDLIQDARRLGIDTVIVALPLAEDRLLSVFAPTRSACALAKCRQATWAAIRF